MIKETTIVLGLAYGDEGKGKITLAHAKSGKYNRTLKFNGSNNAGHSIYHNDKLLITHSIPTGAILGIKSIIGPGCVVNEKSFFNELNELSKTIPDISSNVFIAHNAHIVQDKHIEEEQNENKIGTTRKGIGPAYRDKYARIGMRAEAIESFRPFLIDAYEEFHSKENNLSLLAEGAQAIGLDIDWTPDYPFCTSSHCGIGSVINNGVPYKSINNVEGVIKAYTTYVGSKDFQDPNDPMLDKIGDLGKEYGATTGRRRKVNYLDLDMIEKSINLNSVNILHVNKMDILQELNCWKMFNSGRLIDYQSEESFKLEINHKFPTVKIKYYYSPLSEI